MTESEIASIENEIADYNSEQEEKALAKFKKGSVPKMKWVMEKTLECLLGCIAAVKSGKPPEGRLGPYMSDELARILATETYLSYESCGDRPCMFLRDVGTDPKEFVNKSYYIRDYIRISKF